MDHPTMQAPASPRVAPACACPNRLDLNGETCHLCGRSLTAVTEIPPAPELEDPADVARNMFKAGAGWKEIQRVTGLAEARARKAVDPEAYLEWRSRKNGTARARYVPTGNPVGPPKRLTRRAQAKAVAA